MVHLRQPEPAGRLDRIAPGGVAYDAIIFSGDDVYQIILDGVVDRAYLDALLATVQPDPTYAIDPHPPSPL